jgi:hypothetical protein
MDWGYQGCPLSRGTVGNSGLSSVTDVTRGASVPFPCEMHQMLGRESLWEFCSDFLTPILFSAGTLPNIWIRDYSTTYIIVENIIWAYNISGLLQSYLHIC